MRVQDNVPGIGVPGGEAFRRQALADRYRGRQEERRTDPRAAPRLLVEEPFEGGQQHPTAERVRDQYHLGAARLVGEETAERLSRRGRRRDPACVRQLGDHRQSVVAGPVEGEESGQPVGFGGPEVVHQAGSQPAVALLGTVR